MSMLEYSIPSTVNDSDVETTIFTRRPAWLSFSGQIIFGLATLLIVIGLFVLIKVCVKRWSTIYKVTNQRAIVSKGIISKSIEEIELFRVRDVQVTQTSSQRMLGFGTVTVISSDNSMPVMTLSSIQRPVKCKELIRRHARIARKEAGVIELQSNDDSALSI